MTDKPTALVAATLPETPQETPQTPALESAPAHQIKNPWVCTKEGCGAILGSVVHEKIRPGLSVSSLILFRGAVKIDEALPVNFLFAKIYSGEVVCSRCGSQRIWKPTPETLRYLSESVRKPKS